MNSHHSRLALAFILAASPACGGSNHNGGTDASGGGSDAAASTDAAATIDATPGPDAAPANLACLGQPLPSTAADPITVSGSVFTLSGLSQAPVSGARVAALPVGGGQALDTSTTASDGSYSLTAATGGQPLDAYVRVTKRTYYPTNEYPPTPVTADLSGAPAPLLDSNGVGLINAVYRVGQDMSTNGVLLVIVADCDQNPVAGATVTSNPASGSVVYADDSGYPSSNLTATSSTGLAYLFNAPPNAATTVKATVSGMSLRQHDVKVAQGEITVTGIVP